MRTAFTEQNYKGLKILLFCWWLLLLRSLLPYNWHNKLSHKDVA